MPPACAPELRAELDFDEVVDVVDELDPVPEGDGVVVPEEFDEGGAPVEEEALAVAWKASNDLFAVGLMAKTMPLSQWPVW